MKTTKKAAKKPVAKKTKVKKVAKSRKPVAKKAKAKAKAKPAKKVVKRKVVAKKKVAAKKTAPKAVSKAKKPVGRTVATANFTGVKKPKTPKVKLPTWVIKSFNPTDRKTHKVGYIHEQQAREASKYFTQINCAHTLHDPTGAKIGGHVPA